MALQIVVKLVNGLLYLLYLLLAIPLASATVDSKHMGGVNDMTIMALTGIYSFVFSVVIQVKVYL